MVVRPPLRVVEARYFSSSLIATLDRSQRPPRKIKPAMVTAAAAPPQIHRRRRAGGAVTAVDAGIEAPLRGVRQDALPLPGVEERAGSTSPSRCFRRRRRSTLGLHIAVGRCPRCAPLPARKRSAPRCRASRSGSGRRIAGSRNVTPSTSSDTSNGHRRHRRCRGLSGSTDPRPRSSPIRDAAF